SAPHSGTWNAATDAGTYTIGINGSSVKDLAGNVVAAAASAKTFAVSFNAAPVITSSGSGSVAENAAITTVVYATVATDAESDAITYSLTGTDAASFDISATGDVTLKASADYETKSSYSITVNAKDASHASPTTKDVTIGITNVNEAPTNLALSATSLPENTATVGTLTSTDPDTGNTFTYSIVGGADQASFEVVGTTLQFKSTAKPNYEAKSSYAVTVRTTDQGILNFDKAFTITATDANEAPTAVNLTASSLNATTAIANATAGTLAAVDEDTGNTQTFSLVAGNGTNDADNGKFTIAGNTLKVGATPLAAGTYRIMTRATDNDNLILERAHVITVTAPPAAPDSGSSTPTIITQQVDGVTVQNTTQTGSDGRVTTTQTVAPISTARSEDANTQHSNLADIPVVTDSTGKPLIQVSLPLGVGFTVESISTTGTVQTLRERLIAASDPRVDGDAPMQEIINNGIDQYVPAVGDPNQVTVRTVTLTVPTGTTTAPASPIVIRGATGAGEDDTAYPQRSEALVIDTRKLPSGTVIDLSLVEFAIVVGAVRAVGGTGRNFVIGDDSAQFMVLGADDNVIHGGGGDDTVGSKGGNDRLYGDAGNDRMVGGIGNDTLEGGDGNDILQGGASDAGTWSFTLTPQGQLQVSFAPNSTELADSTGFNAEGKWTYSLGKGPITDDRFAWIYDDYTVAKDVALLVKALGGRLPTLKEMGFLADGTYTSQQLGAMAQSYWTLTEGNVGQPLSTQVQAVINKAWGANSASTELVNLGVNYLNGGGTWSDVWLALARYSTNASKITDTQGGVQLISGSALNETGWSFASGEDTLRGGAGNDVLVGGNGNDVLDGGAGTDVAAFLGQLEDYQAALHMNTTTGQHDVWVRNKLTGEVDTMRNVEMMKIGSTLYYLPPGNPQLPDDVYGALSDYLTPSTQDISLIGFHSDAALMA
ncbi:MAG: hypothetical protein RIR79_1121, partial [Pseudomonadota bacterium]